MAVKKHREEKEMEKNHLIVAASLDRNDLANSLAGYLVIYVSE